MKTLQLVNIWLSTSFSSVQGPRALCPRGMKNMALTYRKLSRSRLVCPEAQMAYILHHAHSDQMSTPKHGHWRHTSSSCWVSQTGMQKCSNFVVGFSFSAILISPINSHSTLRIGLPMLFSVGNVSRSHWVLKSWVSVPSHWCDSAWPYAQILLNSFVGLEVEEHYTVSWICIIT